MAGDILFADLALSEFGSDPPLTHDKDTVGQTHHLGQFGRHDENRAPLARKPQVKPTSTLLRS